MTSLRLSFVVVQFLVNFKKSFNCSGLRKLKNYCQTVPKKSWLNCLVPN